MEGKGDTSARLAHLRDLMKQRGVHVYVIPSEDSHSSEYVASSEARRSFISNFTGSSGCAVVTMDRAALATDGRYFNQAARQLDENWTLLKQGVQEMPTWQEWSAEQSSGGKTVAVDPTLIPATTAKKLIDKISWCGGGGLAPLGENLVDLVWGDTRPARPSKPVAVLSQQFAGRDVSSKLKELRAELKKKKAYGIVLSMLDEVAWLFNLRGSDVPFNPVFFAYAVVTNDSAFLYLDESKLDDECHHHLKANEVTIKPYGAVFEDVRALGARAQSTSDNPSPKLGRVILPTKASWALKLALGGEEVVNELRSPVCDMKSIKNSTELAGMAACHERDGRALTKYFAWLEDQLVNKKAILDEVLAADKLESIRKEQNHYIGLSFATISASGANAAIIHYQPERGSCAIIDSGSIYLCDSGAQYLDGTTDTTRTTHFGKPTETEKRAYTLVLKGNISLDRAVFPRGTSGFALDCLARQHLRRDGLDYRHGTGHGVGSYLNVHEGPIGIGSRPEYAEVSLAPGNVVSIEPGYYEDGKFGIRIENVAVVVEVETANCFGGEPYLGFRHVTMVPYCRNLLDTSLLDAEEKSWLNDHHAMILARYKSVFKDDPLTLAWLERETQPLPI